MRYAAVAGDPAGRAAPGARPVARFRACVERFGSRHLCPPLGANWIQVILGNTSFRDRADDAMREMNLLSIATIHQHIGPAVEAQLTPLGFVLQKPLHWIRSADAPIRQLFCYAQLRGGALAPQWGFSLDFVPHLSGKKIKWHKTEKSALFDAFVDGQGTELNLSYMWGVSGLLEQMQPRVEAAIRAATALWAKGRTYPELYALVEELRSKPGSELYTQLPIANAMCLARSGREAEGLRDLQYFIQRFDLDEQCATSVRRVFDDALASANKTSPK